MSAELLQSAVLFALVWPFLAASLWAIRAARPLAIRLLPWSAAPALAVALLVPDLTLSLPETLLGSGLALDATGRVFLATTALLWLVAGTLMVGRRPGDVGERQQRLLNEPAMRDAYQQFLQRLSREVADRPQVVMARR